MAEKITDCWGVTEQLAVNDEEHRMLYQAAFDALKKSFDILESEEYTNKDGFKLEAKDSKSGDTVYSKHFPEHGKVFFGNAKFAWTAEDLFKNNYDDEKMEKSPQWNPRFAKYTNLYNVTERTKVVYLVMPDQYEVISSRDFVDVKTWRNFDGTFYLSHCSAEFSKMLKQEGKVRGANAPGATRYKPLEGHPDQCTVDWILGVDAKGNIPKPVTDHFTPHQILEYFKNLRNHVEKSKVDK